MPLEVVSRHLAFLEGADLLRLRAVAPDLEYWFRHALVHETAYDSLLKHDRRELHQDVGEALERLYADRLEELAPLLGHHFDEAGDSRAVGYLALAGDSAMRVYAFAEAADHFRRALEAAKVLKPDELARHAGDLGSHYTRLGRALEMGNRFDEALATYAEMSDVAHERNDRKLELGALVARSVLLSTPNPAFSPPEALDASERALRLARDVGDRVAEARILWALSLLHFFTNRLPQAVEYGEESLSIARVVGPPEQVAYSLHNLSMARLVLGDTARASAGMNEAGEMWHELGNAPMLSESMYVLAHSLYLAGDLGRSLDLSERALEISRESHNLWGQSCSLAVKGAVCLELGRAGLAVQAFDQSVRFGEQAGYLLAGVEYRSNLAWANAALGLPERGLELALEAADIARAKFPEFRPYALATVARIQGQLGNLIKAEAAIQEAREGFNPDSFLTPAAAVLPLAEGELFLLRGQYDRAAQVAEELLARLHQRGISVFVPEALHLKGKALMGLGGDRLDHAGEVLSKAHDVGSGLGLHRPVWRILYSLAQLESRRGNLAESDRLIRQADEILDKVAAEVDSQDLRVSILRLKSNRLTVEPHSSSG